MIQTEQQLYQIALPRPVPTDYRELFTAPNGQANAVYRRACLPRICKADIAQLDKHCGQFCRIRLAARGRTAVEKFVHLVGIELMRAEIRDCGEKRADVAAKAVAGIEHRGKRCDGIVSEYYPHSEIQPCCKRKQRGYQVLKAVGSKILRRIAFKQVDPFRDTAEQLLFQHRADIGRFRVVDKGLVVHQPAEIVSAAVERGFFVRIIAVGLCAHQLRHKTDDRADKRKDYQVYIRCYDKPDYRSDRGQQTQRVHAGAPYADAATVRIARCDGIAVVKIGAVKRLCVVISDLVDKAQSKRGCYLHLAYRHVYTTDAALPQQICDIQREHQRKYKCGAPYAPLLRDTFKKAPEKIYVDKRIDNTDGHGYERYEHVFAVNTVQIAYHSENRAFQNTHLRVCAANIMP